MKNNATKSRPEPTFTRTGSISLSLAFALLAFLGSTPEAQGREAIWDGGGADANWSTAANWDTDVAPVSGADKLGWHAGSTTKKVSTNDIDGLSVSGFYTLNAPAGIELNGKKVTVTGTVGHTCNIGSIIINLPLELNTNISFQVASSTMLTINGNITETGGSRAISFVGKEANDLSTFTFNGTNSFSGKVTVGAYNQGATVYINTLGNSNVVQSLGTGELVQFGNRCVLGTVIYTGGATSTDKRFQIGENWDLSVPGSGGTFKNNGTGPVVWTGTHRRVGQAAADTRTFTLGGTNTGSNDWQSVIANNNPGKIALTKSDAGKWILSGNNTYSGATTISGGTLVINGNQSGATGTVTVVSGAALGGSGRTGGAVTLASDGKLKPGDTGGGVPSKLTIDGAFTYENGTLDLSTLTTLAGGTHVLATFPSRSVSNFVSVVDLPSGATVGYTETSITLKAAPKGTVIAIR